MKNERIRELAEQAGLSVIDGEWDYNDREILCQVDGEWRVAAPSEIISVLFDCEKGREKFAELIVRECIDCLKPLSRNHSMVGAAQDTIKEHFGVE